MTAALIAIAIAVFAALLAFWAWGLARISALSDRRIEHLDSPQRGTEALRTTGGSPPLGSPGRAAPMLPDYRPLLTLIDRKRND